MKLKAASGLYPDIEYHEMVEYPEQYQNAKEFRNQTVQTIVHDTKDSEEAEISLGSIIDRLEPCNWNFQGNLILALKAIYGDLHSDKPFAAHGRNVRLNPIRERMRIVENTLRMFYGEVGDQAEIDKDILSSLGEETDAKKVLVQKLILKLGDIV